MDCYLHGGISNECSSIQFPKVVKKTKEAGSPDPGLLVCLAKSLTYTYDQLETFEIVSSVKKKTKAVLSAIGVYLAFNAATFGGAYILWRVFTSPVGQWLEINKPTKPYVPGSLLVLQIFPLMIAFYYYRDKVKRD